MNAAEQFENITGTRFPEYPLALTHPAEFYDTDQGPKSTLGKRVVESPRRYAVMRSTSPRFPDGKRDAVPFGVYNIDMGPKSGFSKSLEQSRIRYAAAFSPSPRFGTWRPASEAPDVMYETHERLTVSQFLRETPLKYSAMNTRAPRLATRGAHDTANADYDVRFGKYKPMAEAAMESGVRYSSMTHKSKSKRGWKIQTEGMGPGSYGFLPSIWDLQKDAKDTRPTPCFISTSKRFGKRR